jgi:lysophospholipase L1-like esterase
MNRKYAAALGCSWAFLITLTAAALAQTPDPAARWEATIARFEQADRDQSPPAGGVLFVGSSSIRMWDTDRWFPDQAVINRGFGGSQIADVLHFADRIVIKYQPRVVVFYAGDNDIKAGKSAEQVAEDFRRLADLIERRLPGTHIIYLPIKPSLARWELWPSMQQANALIRQYLETRYHWHYVDTATVLLDDDGRPRQDVFLQDGLHLNDVGYALWTRQVTPQIARAQTMPEQTATGTVFHDTNGNRRLDRGEPALAGMRVSNGREIVRTGRDGTYRLPVGEDTILFVIKPSGLRTPLDANGLPEFYYIHKPAGSLPSAFPGVAPTGPLPESVDFPLYPQAEPEQFQAILFGDTQTRNLAEVGYLAHDVVEELIGTKAAFGVTLGDIVFDDLSVFEPLNQAIAMIGIPWYNVIGNHDLNFDAIDDRDSDETYERIYGPSYYSFDYGAVHFLVLDDVQWAIDDTTGKGGYRGGLGDEQMAFIRADLAALPDEQMVVLMMHIPLVDVHDRQELYRLIERRPFCLSISGHKHYHEHRFITEADGWRGAKPHHHVINVTACGNWWAGAPDERGIPHATMSDGAPNGYTLLTFDGRQYTIDFRAASRSADYQMNILAPDEVASSQLEQTVVHVNVFNGSERSTVEMQFGSAEDWLPLQRTVAPDPAYTAVVAAEQKLLEQSEAWRKLDRPKPSTHLWQAQLPGGVQPGTHALRVRTTDMHGRTFAASRIIRVTAD